MYLSSVLVQRLLPPYRHLTHGRLFVSLWGVSPRLGEGKYAKKKKKKKKISALRPADEHRYTYSDETKEIWSFQAQKVQNCRIDYFLLLFPNLIIKGKGK